MKKRFTAILRTEKGGHISRVDEDYSTKKAYASDCRGNGYKVTAILTDEEIDSIHKALDPKNWNDPNRWNVIHRYSALVIDFVHQCL